MRLILSLFDNIYNRNKSLLVFIFLASVLCSLFFLFFFINIGPVQHRIPGTDYFFAFEPMANNILQGKGLTLNGSLPLNFAPGLSVILSGVFAFSQITGIDKFDLIVVLNVILTALSCCFLFLIAKEIFNKRIALIASLLWMSYPFNLWLIKNPNTEVPFILLLYLGIFFYVLALKRRSLKFTFFSGLFLGLASFIRLIGLFLPLFLGLLIFFFLRSDPKRRQVLLVIILLIGNLIAIFPWMVCAFSATGGFIPISNLGPYGFTFGITYLLATGEGGNRMVLSDDVTMLIERVRTEDLNSGIKIFKFLVQELINRPVTLIKLMGLKLARSWYATSQQWWEREILAVQILYLVTGIGGIVYGIKAAKDKTRDIILLLAVIFYFWGISFINVSILRFMIPVMGLVIIFSAIAVNRLIKRIKLCPPCHP